MLFMYVSMKWEIVYTSAHLVEQTERCQNIVDCAQIRLLSSVVYLHRERQRERAAPPIRSAVVRTGNDKVIEPASTPIQQPGQCTKAVLRVLQDWERDSREVEVDSVRRSIIHLHLET